MFRNPSTQALLNTLPLPNQATTATGYNYMPGGGLLSNLDSQIGTLPPSAIAPRCRRAATAAVKLEMVPLNGPIVCGVTTRARGTALLVGRGADYRLSRHVAYRVVDAAWLRTQLANGTTTVQNDLRLGAGVALRF